MSSIEPPPKEKFGKSNPMPLRLRSNSGRTKCGVTAVAKSRGGGSGGWGMK